MIEVITPGFLTTVQDLGRAGFANIGLPISGSMDQYSSKLANAILDNDVNDAVLEITLGRCKLLFKEETFICITGADYSAKINSKEISLNKAIKVKKGDLVSFDKKRKGIRTYLSVKGGFKTKEVLNSRSFFRSITPQAIVKKGDRLPFKASWKNIEASFSSLKINDSHFETKSISCFKGPEYALLSEKQKKELKEILFTISNDNNRMGYQLKEIIPNTLNSMLTSSVLPGTVQLTPSGKIIILMRDCQVTGGYPRILVLTNDAINILSQKTTNDSFYFKVTDYPK